MLVHYLILKTKKNQKQHTYTIFQEVGLSDLANQNLKPWPQTKWKSNLKVLADSIYFCMQSNRSTPKIWLLILHSSFQRLNLT